MEQLKTQKKETAEKTGLALKQKLEEFLDLQVQLATDAIDHFDCPVSVIDPETNQTKKLMSDRQCNEYIDAIKRVQTDSQTSLERQKDFVTVELLNKVHSKMLTVISDQNLFKYLELQKKYELCEDMYVPLDKQQQNIDFELEVNDLEKLKVEPIVLENKEHGY